MAYWARSGVCKRSEVGALNLLKVLDLAPGRIADCAGNVDFEP
jgi:hypothetical protein